MHFKWPLNCELIYGLPLFVKLNRRVLVDHPVAEQNDERLVGLAAEDTLHINIGTDVIDVLFQITRAQVVNVRLLSIGVGGCKNPRFIGIKRSLIEEVGVHGPYRFIRRPGPCVNVPDRVER